MTGGVTIRGLGKSYGGFKALSGMSVDLPAGEVFGLIGPNGAGKTTALKCVAGLIRDHDGEVLIEGLPLSEEGVRNRIGYMPQSPRFGTWRSVHRTLRVLGRLNGMEPEGLDARIGEVLEMLGIADRRDSPVTTLSGGTLQKLGLAQAILHRPPVLILDEPMASLDPESRRLARGIILAQRDRGATVVFSSHILSDVQDIADSVGILHRGAMLRLGTMSEVRREMSSGPALELSLSRDPLLDISSLRGVASSEAIGPGSYRIRLQPGLDADEVLDELVRSLLEAGGALRSLVPLSRSLEDIYLQQLEGSA